MYYVGSKSYSTLSEAVAAAQATNGTVTSQPVTDTTTDGGMLSGTSTTSTDTTFDPSATDGFDPNAESTNEAPTTTNPTPEGAVAETSTAPQTFTFFEGAERGGASPDSLYGSRDATQMTEAELRTYFEGDTVNRLPEVFGSFDNYLAYMTEREQLIQAGDYDVGSWDEYTGSLTEDDLMILEGEDLTMYGDDANMTYEELYASRTQNQKAAYENWVNSDANQALMQKYGVTDVVYSGTGDKFRWNGSAYVKTVNEDHAGLTEYVKMAMVTALGVATGGALAGAGLGTTTSAALSQAITQAVTTGSIDVEAILTSAATAGLSNALTDVLGTALSDVIPNIDEVFSTGVESVDNVLSTMAMDAVRQGVSTGSVDFQQVLQSGAFSAASEFVEFIQGNMNASAEDQAAFEAKWAEMQAEQHQEMFNTLEQQFGEGALTEALNSMDAELAMMATQNLAEMFAANNVEVSQSADGTWTEEQVVDVSGDTTTQPVYDTPPAQITNPFEGDTLTNGVYYNEAGFPVGVHPDATADQILEQFVNDKNAWSTLSGSAHGMPPEAIAILVEASGGTVQGLSDLLVENGLVLAQGEGGQYVMISGSNSTTGLHTSLNQDALLDLQAPTENNYMPNPQPTNDLLNPTDTSDISQEMQDILTNVEEQPPIIEAEYNIDPSVIEPEPIVPDPIDAVDPVEPPVTSDPTDTTSGDAGATGDAGAGSGITVSDVTTAVNEAINALPEAATPQDVQDAIDTAVATIEVPPSMTPEEVQEIVEGAVAGIDIPEGVTAAEMEEAISGAVTDLASTADVTAAVDGAVATLQEQIAALPAGASPTEVQTAIDTAIAGIEFPAGLTAEDVQSVVDTAVSGITFPESVTSEQVSSAISDAVTDLASTADVTAAVDGAVATLQEQIAALPAGASPTEVQTAIDTAIAGIEFPAGLSSEDVSSIVDTAIGGITFPEGLSEAEVSTIVDTALTGVATTVDMNNAIDAAVEGLNQAIADIPEGMTAVEVGEIVDASIASIEFPESVTNEQMTTAISNAISGIQFPEGLTAEDVAQVVSNSGFATPENVAESIANAGYVTPEELGSALETAGFSTPQDVADAIAAAGYSTPEDVNAAIANAGFSTPEDVAAAIAAAGYSTPEDIANAVANAGYATPEDVASAIASAGYVNPEDLASALENSGFASADSLQTAQEAIDGQIGDLEASLLETLANNAQGSTDALTDAEARLLESISGVEADVLQELSQTTDGFNQAISDMDVNFQEALSGGLESVQTSLMETLELYNTGQGEALSAAEARLLESITGGDAATLQSMSENAETFNQALADLGVDITDVQTNLGDRISTLSGDVSTGFETAAEERQDLMEALTAVELGQAEALTDAQAALLAEITGGDAATLQELSTVQGALEGELETLGTSIGDVEAGLTEDIAAFQEETVSGFEQVGEDIASSEDRMTTLFNQGLESVGGDINALAQQSLDQYGSLQDTLASQAEGQAEALTDTEARLLQNMTGIESSVLQELSTVQGGLENALSDVGMDIEGLAGDVDSRIGDVETAMGSGFEGVAEQFGQVQGDLEGLGAGIAGLGSGLAGVGSGLLSGLGQLGAGQQALQQKISAPKWEDFYTGDISAGRRDFQSQYIGQPQQSNAVNNLNQMIGRSLEMSPNTQGMFGNLQNKG